MSDISKHSPFPDLSGPAEEDKPKSWFDPLVDLGLLTLQSIGKLQSQERTAVISDLNSRVKFNAKNFTTQEEFNALNQELDAAMAEYGGNKKSALHMRRLDEALQQLESNFISDQEIKAYSTNVYQHLLSVDDPQLKTAGAEKFVTIGNDLLNKYKGTKDGPVMNNLEEALKNITTMDKVGKIITQGDIQYGEHVAGKPTPEWDIHHQAVNELISDIEMNNFSGIRNSMADIKELDELLMQDKIIKPAEEVIYAANESIRHDLDQIPGIKKVDGDEKTFKERMAGFIPGGKKGALLINRQTLPVMRYDIDQFMQKYMTEAGAEIQDSDIEKAVDSGSMTALIEELDKNAAVLYNADELSAGQIRDLPFDDLMKLLHRNIRYKDERDAWAPFGWFDKDIPSYNTILAKTILNYIALGDVKMKMDRMNRLGR